MAIRDIKFSYEMNELVLQGKKCCTTRLSTKCSAGDKFIIRTRVYRVITVYIEKYSEDFINRYFKIEGFETPGEFKDVLNNIYPEIECGTELYVHYFSYVGEMCKECVDILTRDD